ncbi:TetR/AcrR family transcriptional regulator [Streptomyces sp. Tu102]|uniref:TetR/AcrR family transcriptional regulator n=1 Tax=Streptomyces TaxID=1883 RepID=UPI001BDC4EDD|nr:TetR/AcrR family transcriptional regulator [Streptomyces sp. Tu102]MBT1098053.1 TetR/AcrR family transcriptional regulator [Streptomyces sp. Tu102]
MPHRTDGTYHHGDLAAACVTAALALLEEGVPSSGLSIRAVARRAGVTPAAPYRHYADRDALLSAVATVGYRELAEDLFSANAKPSSPEDIADVAVAYVKFAARRPALFRVMFGPCDVENAERVAAADIISAYLADVVGRLFPKADSGPLAMAAWALVHGLAVLHIDGKLDTSTQGAISATVRSTVLAAFAPAATSARDCS